MTKLVTSLIEAWWEKGKRAATHANQVSDAPGFCKREMFEEGRDGVMKADKQIFYWNTIGGE